MASDLLRQCETARMAGLDFPTVWTTILRVHPLVAGPAIEVADGNRTWLEIPLTTGGRLACDADGSYRLVNRVSLLTRGF
jgi:hypothetical protein